MATRLFAPAGSMSMPLNTVAAQLQLSPVSGTCLMISNVTSNEAVVLITTASANTVAIPVSTSSSLNGMSIPGNKTLGIDASQQGATGLWISALAPVAATTTTLRITQGEGGLS